MTCSRHDLKNNTNLMAPQYICGKVNNQNGSGITPISPNKSNKSKIDDTCRGLSAMQINTSKIASGFDKTAPTSTSRKIGLLGREDGSKIDGRVECCWDIFTSHRQGEPKTAVIRPDYLLEYINIALTCQ